MSPMEQFIRNIGKRIEEMEIEIDHLKSIKERIEREYNSSENSF